MKKIHNFDTIRLWAAAAVIFSHSFLIAEGHEDNEPFQIETGEIAGIYGVYVFFILSGFLITRSLLHSSSNRSYFWKRFLRVYPAYAASIVVVALVVGAAYSNDPIKVFVRDPALWRTIFHGLVFDIKNYEIAGFVFYEDGRVLGTVLNGVLWTIQAEVIFYISIVVLHSIGLLRTWVIFTISMCALVSLIVQLGGGSLFPATGNLVYLDKWGLSFGAPGFFLGAFFYLILRDENQLRGDVALAFAAACIILPMMDLSGVLSWGGHTHALFSVLAAYPILWLGGASAPNLGYWARFGDLSYGVYVFGWPVQQILRSWTGEGWSGWAFFPLCMVAALGVAVISWRFIEHPALRMKNHVS